MLIGFFLSLARNWKTGPWFFQSVLEAYAWKNVMLTGFSTLSPADTLEDALHKAVHTLQDDFPWCVAATWWRHQQTTHRESLRVGGNGYVQSAMVRAFDIAQRTDSLGSAFRKLGGRGLNMIPWSINSGWWESSPCKT